MKLIIITIVLIKYYRDIRRKENDFLEIEIFGIEDEEAISDMAESIYPKYLYREQYNKCIKILKELYQWTNDKFYHEMTAFHEIALNGFLEYMSDIQSDCPKFKKCISIKN